MPRTIATEEDWLDEGLRCFSTGGLSALRVEAMARALGCSKSSFYWYFPDRDAFVERLLRRWSQVGTGDVIARLSSLPGPPERFRALLLEAFSARQGADFLFYLRHLARDHAGAAALLAQTESSRVAYIAQLLREGGLREDISAERAGLIYAYYLGWYEQNKHRSPEPGEIARLIDLLVRSLGLPASFL